MTFAEAQAICLDLLSEYVPDLKKKTRLELSSRLLAELEDQGALDVDDFPEEDEEELE